MDINKENLLQERHERVTRMNNDSLRVKALDQMLETISNSTLEAKLDKIRKEAFSDACNNYLGPRDIIDSVLNLAVKYGVIRED